MPLYDKIGISYDITRRADAFIASRLIHHLKVDGRSKYLDVACGSGNYTVALANSGMSMYGVDQSSVMIETASSKCNRTVWNIGDVEALPYKDREFAGAISTLAIHHFKDLQTAFSEVFRVINNGRFVIFTSTPEQMRGYWLNEYFPCTMAKSIAQMPSMDQISAKLTAAGFNSVTAEIYEVRRDLQDLFLYCGKERPEYYLDPRIRVGSSTFASLANQPEIEEGCQRLANDLKTGKIASVISSYTHNQGDYLFVVAGK